MMEPDARSWWNSLSDREQIIWALKVCDGEDPVYVAQKPWKWEKEAFYAAHAATFNRKVGSGE